MSASPYDHCINLIPVVLWAQNDLTDEKRAAILELIDKKKFNDAEAGEELTVTARARRKAWARLLAKVYEIDVFKCPRCGSRMSVVGVIRDPESIRKIIACLETKGRGPP